MPRHLVPAVLAGLCAVAAAQERAAAERAPRPHVVFFLADDLGWNDVGYHGSDIATPNVDALARAGTRLERFYVQPVCSPTRAAFLTGRYPIRYGLQFGVVRPWADYGLPLDERLLSEALRDAGYATAICGKWHLGTVTRAHLPTARGFDHQYGHFLGAIDYWRHDRMGGKDWNRDDRPLDEEGYTTELIAAECERLIAAHDPDTPLFLYVPFNAPHTPLQAPDRYLERYAEMENARRRAFAAMVTCLDDAIGRVLGALERRGMRSDTLVLFASDNGGPRGRNAGADNTPLRGGKGTLYEGGVRVPAIACWPGRVPAGATVREPLHIVDLFPTLCRLAGADAAGGKPLDGEDAWATIARGAPSPHEDILIQAEPRRAAIRAGSWKLVEKRGRRRRRTAGRPPRYELYDLEADPGEERDLSAAAPGKLAELRARLERYRRAAVQPRGGQARPPEGFSVPERWGHR